MKYLIWLTVFIFSIVTIAEVPPLSPEQIKNCEFYAAEIASTSGEKVEKLLWVQRSMALNSCDVYFEIPHSYRFARDGCSGADRVITLNLDHYNLVYDYFESFDCGNKY